MIKKKKISVIVLEIIVIILAIVGVTLALSYAMKRININATTANLSVNYDGNLILPSTSLYPIDDSEVDTNTKNVMRIEFSIKGAITNRSESPIIYDVILSDLNIDCELKKYLKWKLYKNDSLLYEGSFSPEFDLLEDNKLWLTEIQQDLPKSSETADSYELVVWLSEACSDVTTCTLNDDQSLTYGKTISGKIETILHLNSKKPLERKKMNGKFSCPNRPDLVEGLVPITYSDNKWVKADSTNVNNSWYDYTSKKWANAVLVTSDYRDANNKDTFDVGDEVPEDAILAYYVWIPRYKYKVWNINKVMGTDSYGARTNGIDVVFENGTNTTGTISCNNYSFDTPSSSANSPNETCSGANGEYYTHPAFTFGEDELRGIWVGKYEISAPENSDCYANTTSVNCGNATLSVRVKPNVNSWRANYLTNFSKVIQNMSLENNEYGLIDTSDSHMIKNMEWGAVAYLTHSGYGRCSSDGCEEISLNSYYIATATVTGFKTGCGPQNEGVISNGSLCNEYNTELGQLASTTANVYGVYDMSGGVGEVVMGNMSSTSGSYTYYPNSGGSEFSYSEATEKYIDTYAYGTTTGDQAAYNRAKLGDATGEIVSIVKYGWYDDYVNFFASTKSWFTRGGAYNSSTSAGVFFGSYSVGAAYSNVSTRAVLVGEE